MEEMPHTRLEYEKEISQIDKQIAQLESHRDELAKSRTQLDVGQLGEAKRIRKKLDEVEGSLSDLSLLKQAAEQQLAKWKKNALPSETLRQEVGEMFEEARSLVDQIMKAQQDVAGYLEKIDAINNKIGEMEHQHLNLIGEDMHAPPRIVIYQAMAFAWSNVERIKNYDPWTYVSDDEIAAQAKAEREERRRAYEKLLKTANENAPDCPRCADRDEAVTLQVDLHAGGRDTPGQTINDGQWYLECPRCKIRTSATIPQTRIHG
jgi:hypothetical protein